MDPATVTEHATADELEAGLLALDPSPADVGRLHLIVARPAEGVRTSPEEALLDSIEGLVGDNWRTRTNRSTPDGLADSDRQLTIMNWRVAALVACHPDRIPLAGDQLYVDMDLSVDNLPAGTRVSVGSAVIEVSEAPHLGCAKFVSRFGPDAMALVNSPTGRRLRLRGANARVITSGRIRTGDVVTKLVSR